MKRQAAQRPALSGMKSMTANYPGHRSKSQVPNLTCSDRHPCVTGSQGRPVHTPPAESCETTATASCLLWGCSRSSTEARSPAQAIWARLWTLPLRLPSPPEREGRGSSKCQPHLLGVLRMVCRRDSGPGRKMCQAMEQSSMLFTVRRAPCSTGVSCLTAEARAARSVG